jgi:hypothetical protein
MKGQGTCSIDQLLAQPAIPFLFLSCAESLCPNLLTKYRLTKIEWRTICTTPVCLPYIYFDGLVDDFEFLGTLRYGFVGV